MLVAVRACMHRSCLAVVTFAAIAGCAPAVAVRASSVPYLGVPGSTLHLPMARDQVLAEVTALMDKRGFHLVLSYPAKDGSGDVVYKYEGPRGVAVVGAGDEVSTAIGSYQLGSVFFASMHVTADTSTDLLLIGKPVAPNTTTEVCSDDDSLLKRYEYWCLDSTLRNGGPLWAQLSGQEEAEVVRGVLLELVTLRQGASLAKSH